MKRHHLAFAKRHAAAFAVRGLMVFGLGVLLAGCQTTGPDYTGAVDNNGPMDYSGALWSDYRVRHPISIVEKDRSLNIFVGSARNGLTPEQRADVLGFAQSWRDEGTSRFVIDQPNGVSNARAAAIAMQEIRTILISAGVPSQAIKVQHRRGEPGTLAVIKITYPALAAHAGPCGQWPDDLGPANIPQRAENIHYWNYGCATQRNLAAMVANPADLVQPRAETPAHAGRRSVALEKYRKGEPTAAVSTDSEKGKISGVGK
jgi:pilus assembly protein CpaD